jgi:hypothetical protein
MSLTERHHGGVFSFISNRPTPLPGELTLLSQRMTWPSIEAVNRRSEEYTAYAEEFNSGGAFLGGGTMPSVPRPFECGIDDLSAALDGTARLLEGRAKWEVPGPETPRPFSGSASASGSSSKSGSNEASDLASASWLWAFVLTDD